MIASLSGCASISSITDGKRDVEFHIINATSNNYEVDIEVTNTGSSPIANEFLMNPESVQSLTEELSPAKYELRVIVSDPNIEKQLDWKVNKPDCSREVYVTLHPATEGLRLLVNPGVCGSE